MVAKVQDPRRCNNLSACLIDNKLQNVRTLSKQSFCCKFLFMNTWADHVARLLDIITHSSYFGYEYRFMQCSLLKPTLVQLYKSEFFTLVTCDKTSLLRVNSVTCLIPKQGK
jgi:hypothetical protein